MQIRANPSLKEEYALGVLSFVPWNNIVFLANFGVWFLHNCHMVL
jgi:hypothetical protein